MRLSLHWHLEIKFKRGAPLSTVPRALARVNLLSAICADLQLSGNVFSIASTDHSRPRPSRNAAMHTYTLRRIYAGQTFTGRLDANSIVELARHHALLNFKAW